MCVSTYHLMRFWFSFLFLFDRKHCTTTMLLFLFECCLLFSVQQIDFLSFITVVVLCAPQPSDLSPVRLTLAAAMRFPPLPCFLFSWQLCQGPHIEEVERSCCTNLVDRLTYISGPMVYFCSIIIYLPGRQSGRKQGCAEACARKVRRPTPMTSISLLAHFSSHSLKLCHAGLLCRRLPVGPLPESQSRAQPQLIGLGTRAAGRGLSPHQSPRSTQAQNIKESKG